MKRATKEVLYFEVGRDNVPTLKVEPGEQFEVETQMNSGPWLDTHPRGEELREKLSGGNPSSGCIFVNGAQPGDRLTVHVGQFELAPMGYTCFSGGNNACPSWLGGGGIGRISKIVEIRDGLIHWDEKRKIPARPMLGYVGVAPRSERYHNGWGGYWGGNFDAQEITTGARVHLPVNVPGALLHVGDMHAVQGDGEICGAGGVETEGVVRLRCELSPMPKSMNYPRLENDSHLIAVAMDKPAEDAFRRALEALILWIEEDCGMSRGDIYMLLAQVMEARCTQFVNPTYTYLAKIARVYL